MIGNFPDPYPDELLYSVCARFSDRKGYSNRRFVVCDLFGDRNATIIVDLPRRLGNLVASLPPEHSYTVELFIDDHTLLPFYGPFLAPDKLNSIYCDMYGDQGVGIPMRLGILGAKIPLPKWLRFCPQCIEDDRRVFGECYWHRIHQISGVFICPIHNIFLQNSDAPAHHLRSRLEFKSAEKADKTISDNLPHIFMAHSNTLLAIAEDVAWLLKQRKLTYGLEVLQKKYLAVLAAQGLVTPSGKVRMDDLKRAFNKYYSPELLSKLGCVVVENMIDSWLTRLLRPFEQSKRAQHPLHHLLMIQFLGYKSEDFFRLPVSAAPFGEGPWPCLNPAADHFREFMIPHCSISHDSKIPGGVIGIFSCFCGFTYTRKGPDISTDGQYKWLRVRSRGDIWNAALQQLWEDPSVSLFDASTRLDICKETLKIKAKHLGLSFPRPYIEFNKRAKVKIPKGPDISESARETHRTIWLTALKEYPDDTVQELWRKRNVAGAYAWLRKYDAEWLHMHMVSGKKWKKYLSTFPTRIDWEYRDEQIAEKLRSSALKLKSGSERPRRVSVAAIGDDIGQLALLQRHLNKLPITAKVLSEVIETYEDCGVRRVHWAARLYQQENIRPTYRQLVRRASVEDMKDHPQVKKAIDMALYELSVPMTH